MIDASGVAIQFPESISRIATELTNDNVAGKSARFRLIIRSIKVEQVQQATAEQFDSKERDYRELSNE